MRRSLSNPARWTVYVEALALAAEYRGQHAVAREVGISMPGLAGLLQGRSPQHATERKVASWYARRPKIDPPPPEVVDVLLRKLVADLPAEYQRAAVEAMRSALDAFRAHDEARRAAIAEGRVPPAAPAKPAVPGPGDPLPIVPAFCPGRRAARAAPAVRRERAHPAVGGRAVREGRGMIGEDEVRELLGAPPHSVQSRRVD